MPKKENLTEQNTENLKDYFEFIRECKTCHLNYGSDLKEKYDNSICPICENQLWNETLKIMEKKPRRTKAELEAEPIRLPNFPKKKKL